jgi:hypothetical protein
MGGTSSDAKRLDAGDQDDPNELAESGEVARDTVRPAFDVEAYAEEMVGRERLPTVTDEVATEEARIASVLIDSNPPAGRASAPDTQVGVAYSELDALSLDEQLAFLRARLAPMSRVPSLKRRLTELGPVIEDPKTAYILGFIDGILPLETIVEVAGLPELDTLRILERAVDQHLLTFERADDR